MERVHRHDLKSRQLPLRTAHRGGVAVLCKHRMAVIHPAQRGLAHPGLGAALAQGPGRAMAGRSLHAKALNVVVVHALEEIPGLVVGAGVGACLGLRVCVRVAAAM